MARHGFSKDTIKTKCIDTQPDGNTIQSIDKYGSSILSSKISYGILFGVFSIGGTIHASLNIAAGSPDSAVSLMFGRAALYTRAISGYNRFNKLSKGEWVIVDTPKPKPVEEKTPVHQNVAMPA